MGRAILEEYNRAFKVGRSNEIISGAHKAGFTFENATGRLS